MGISAATLSRFECDEMNGQRPDFGQDWAVAGGETRGRMSERDYLAEAFQMADSEMYSAYSLPSLAEQASLAHITALVAYIRQQEALLERGRLEAAGRSGELDHSVEAVLDFAEQIRVNDK
jgi:hypothetical protein